MTLLEKAIFQSIKEHNASEERRGSLEKFNRGIKFLEMTPAVRNRKPYGDTRHYAYPNPDKNDWTTSIEVRDTFLDLEVKCRFTPDGKYDDNVVLYEVLVISSGEIAVYFDGTEYEHSSSNK